MRYFMKMIFRRVRSLLLRQLDERKKKNITHGIKGKSINERWTVNNIRPERERMREKR